MTANPTGQQLNYAAFTGRIYSQVQHRGHLKVQKLDGWNLAPIRGGRGALNVL